MAAPAATFPTQSPPSTNQEALNLDDILFDFSSILFSPSSSPRIAALTSPLTTCAGTCEKPAIDDHNPFSVRSHVLPRSASAETLQNADSVHTIDRSPPDEATVSISADTSTTDPHHGSGSIPRVRSASCVTETAAGLVTGTASSSSQEKYISGWQKIQERLAEKKGRRVCPPPYAKTLSSSEPQFGGHGGYGKQNRVIHPKPPKPPLPPKPRPANVFLPGQEGLSPRLKGRKPKNELMLESVKSNLFEKRWEPKSSAGDGCSSRVLALLLTLLFGILVLFQGSSSVSQMDVKQNSPVLPKNTSMDGYHDRRVSESWRVAPRRHGPSSAVSL